MFLSKKFAGKLANIEIVAKDDLDMVGGTIRILVAFVDRMRQARLTRR